MQKNCCPIVKWYVAIILLKIVIVHSTIFHCKYVKNSAEIKKATDIRAVLTMYATKKNLAVKIACTIWQ